MKFMFLYISGKGFGSTVRAQIGIEILSEILSVSLEKTRARLEISGEMVTSKELALDITRMRMNISRIMLNYLQIKMLRLTRKDSGVMLLSLHFKWRFQAQK